MDDNASQWGLLNGSDADVSVEPLTADSTSVRQAVDSRASLGWPRLTGLTVDFCGIFFAYSLQGVVIVPLFLSFGLTQSQTSLVMLTSPIAVICVFPLIGVVSDRCTLSIGRRRPFILAGVAIQITGFALLASAPDIGYLLGDPLPTPGEGNDSAQVPLQIWAVLIGLVGYAFVDFAAGVMQLPTRALLMDLAPTRQQPNGAALLAFFMSLGNALGYLLGSVNWSQFAGLAWLGSQACPVGSCLNYRFLFVLASLLDALTVAVTCLSVTEERYTPPIGESGANNETGLSGWCSSTSAMVALALKDMYSYVRHRMDPRMIRILVVYFVCWLSWPLWTFYIGDWVGTVVYDGDPTAAEGTTSRENYDQGVETASFAMFLYSIVAFLYSLVVPLIVKIPVLRYKGAWGLAMLWHALIYFLLIVGSNSITFTVILIALAGVNLATMHVVPWILVGYLTLPRDMGIAYAVVNVFNALPSLLLNGIVNPGLEYIFSSLVPVMCFGGITMGLSGILAIVLIKPANVDTSKAL